MKGPPADAFQSSEPEPEPDPEPVEEAPKKRGPPSRGPPDQRAAPARGPPSRRGPPGREPVQTEQSEESTFDAAFARMTGQEGENIVDAEDLAAQEAAKAKAEAAEEAVALTEETDKWEEAEEEEEPLPEIEPLPQDTAEGSRYPKLKKANTGPSRMHHSKDTSSRTHIGIGLGICRSRSTVTDSLNWLMISWI